MLQKIPTAKNMNILTNSRTLLLTRLPVRSVNNIILHRWMIDNDGVVGEIIENASLEKDIEELTRLETGGSYIMRNWMESYDNQQESKK